MKKPTLETRSDCPIATTLDVVGDRWTLVIVRDMLNGKSKFGQFLDSPERITTNILTKRLETMVAQGLARKQVYQERPRRHQYVLTAKGRSLGPLLLEMCRWGNASYPATWKAPDGFGEQKDLT